VGPNPATHSQRSTSPATRTAYVGDSQWHHFGPQPAPAIRASSPQTAPHSQAGEPPRPYSTSLPEGP
jgi:hypothetical protein